MQLKKEPQTQEITGYDKEELFVHAYIKHMGNGAAAAREVFKLKKDNSAYVQASKMLRKAKVKMLINEHMSERRRQYEQFKKQGAFYLFIIASQLVKRIQDDKTPFDELIKAIELLARLVGKEISEPVVIAEIKSGTVKIESNG